MTKKYLLMVASVALSVGVSACGGNVSGTYTGTETITGGTSAQSAYNTTPADSVTVQVTQDSGAVTGSYTASNSNESFQLIGSVSGSSINAQLVSTSTGVGGYGGYGSYGTCYGNSFSGTLNVSGNVLSGTLSSTSTSTTGVTSVSPCVRTVNAFKSN